MPREWADVQELCGRSSEKGRGNETEAGEESLPVGVQGHPHERQRRRERRKERRKEGGKEGEGGRREERKEGAKASQTVAQP